ncbi:MULTISPECIES: iron chelate uptake ABC transporter family permease subunit [Tatumella]|uniref:Ferric enterobactin transport system permease protein n=1 Tax=Tatumella ptyseos ATCC 33301 TaxID=1005995 RepID=A0A085JQ99_9GAMM|nr:MULTISPECIES: iron chelate uptake ABC transporter family permease subunit [Tatumella]KFD22645.1 ferric enterobactin transport system permease protein [Tatumella ptyseos ATCC 33301]
MRQSCLLILLVICLLLLVMLSLSAGAVPVSFRESWQALFSPDPCLSQNCTLIRYARLPRTLAGIAAGASLGLAGALLQTLTRNPLADTGILGINSGASFAIVLGMAFAGADTPLAWLGFAFAGALIALLIISLAGAAAGGNINPLRLTLAGVALAAVLEGMTNGLSLMNPDIYDHLRFWLSGSLDIRQFTSLLILSPAMITGGVLALLLARSLNNISMGGEVAVTLGTRVVRTRILGLISVALLAGAATALTGPIAFIGLMAPHLSRFLAGSDHRRMLPVTLLLTPCLLLMADIAGRFLAAGELRVSIVTGFIGAPVLIFLVRRQSQGAIL